MNQRKAIKLARKKSRGIPSTAKIMSWWKQQPDNDFDIDSAKNDIALMSGDAESTDYNLSAYHHANEGGLDREIATARAREDYYDHYSNPMHSTARTRRQFKQPRAQALHEADKNSRLLADRYEAHPNYDRGSSYNYGTGSYIGGTNAQQVYDQQYFKNTYDLKHGRGAAYKKGADFRMNYDEDGFPQSMDVENANDILKRRDKLSKSNVPISTSDLGGIDDYGTSNYDDDGEEDGGFVDPRVSKIEAEERVKEKDSKWAKKHGVK